MSTAHTHVDRPPEVGDRVYRLGTRWINFYLVEDGGELTLIDAGYPAYWRHLVGAVQALGTRLEAIRAVILTHHHADHVGTAARLRATTGARVLVGAEDAWIVGGRYPSHANPGFYRQCILRPSGLGFLAHSAAAGGSRYQPVPDVESITTGDETLDLPGRPRLIHTPGHTAGHRSVALPDRGVLVAGDALATFDYISGRHGLGQHRLNDDREIALTSLARLDALDAEIVLVAHGDPWTGGLHRALEAVRQDAE